MSERYVAASLPASDLAVHERCNWGRPIGFGKSAAVLVIDMCRYFTEEQYPYSCPETGIPAAKAIARLLTVARQAALPIIYTTQDLTPRTLVTAGRFTEKMNPIDGSFARDRRSHEIVPEVQPHDGDTVIVKPKPSALYGTQLVGMLNFLNVDTLIVTGVTTSGCVRATVDHAFAYNYRVIVPIECVADRVKLPHEINLYDMDTTSADVRPLASVVSSITAQITPGMAADVSRATAAVGGEGSR